MHVGFQNMETHLCRIFSFATWKKFDSELSCCFWRCRVIGVTYEALFKIFQKAKTNQCRLILIYITLIIIKFEKSFEIFPKLYLSDSSLNVATFHNGRRPLPGRGGWQSFYLYLLTITRQCALRVYSNRMNEATTLRVTLGSKGQLLPTFWYLNDLGCYRVDRGLVN